MVRATGALIGRAGRGQAEELRHALDPEQRRARAQLAALCRWHGKDTTLTDAVAARLERAALDRRIDELLAEAPRMTPEQADRLAALRPSAVGW